jgi:hypothetical protein
LGRLWWLDLSAARSNQGDSGCTADGALRWPVLALGCLLAVAAARRRREITSRLPPVTRGRNLLLVVAPALAGVARTSVKTTVFVAALALAAPLAYAQVARPFSFDGAQLADTWGAALPPSKALMLAGRAYFSSSVGGGSAVSLVTDGTAKGTRALAGAGPETSGGVILGAALGQVFYLAPALQGTAWQLRRTGPAGEVLMETFAGGETVGDVAELGGFAWFVVFRAGEAGLCRTDGTPGGLQEMLLLSEDTRLLGGSGTHLLLITGVNGSAHLVATNGLAVGTSQVDITPPQGSQLAWLGMWQGWFYYWVVSGAGQYELHRSDGIVSETVCLVCRPALDPLSHGLPYYPVPVAFHDGLMYFLARNASSLTQLWRTDGTPGGTGPLTGGLVQGVVQRDFAVFDGAVYFSTRYADRGRVYRTDGTLAGTVNVLDLPLAEFNGAPAFTRGDKLYLTGSRLWRMDAGGRNFRDVGIQTKGELGWPMLGVFAELEAGVLVTDSCYRLWLVDPLQPRISTNSNGCRAGTTGNWPALALACLLMLVALRWRELFAWRRAGAHTLPAGERRPAPRELP